MASGGKKKTTMAKLARENRLRERRVIKKARKDERKRAAKESPGLVSEELLEFDVDGMPVVTAADTDTDTEADAADSDAADSDVADVVPQPPSAA